MEQLMINHNIFLSSEDQTAAAFLLIGMGDTSADGRVDAYAGPTARNPLDEMVTYVEGQ